MKTFRPLVAVAAATLLPLALLPTTTASASDASFAASESIMFDGFCDGMQINLPAGGGGAGTLDGAQIGCDVNPIFGTAAPKKGTYGVTAGREFITIQAYGIFTVIRNDHTFTHYLLSGGQLFDALDGTWSAATPGNQNASGTSSIDAALTAAAEGDSSDIDVPRKGPETLNITFDGYCDGMTLINPSQGTSQRRTVDGVLTGCVDPIPLMGAKGLVQDVKTSYAATYDNGGGSYLHTAILRDGTWIHYALSVDGVLEVRNSGTWSEGTPPQTPGLTASGAVS